MPVPTCNFGTSALRSLLLIPLFSLLLALTGCTVSMISPHDPDTIKRIEHFGSSVNGLLLALEEQDGQQPECQYSHYAERYRDLKVQLQTMDLYEQAKTDNKNTQTQVKLLGERLDLLINDHRRLCPPAVAVSITRNQVNDMLGAMLKLENLKNADSPRPTFAPLL